MVERAITLILIMYISHFYTQSGALQKRLVKNMKDICLHFNVPWGRFRHKVWQGFFITRYLP